MKNIYLLFMFVVSGAFSHSSYAEPDGTCWTDPVMAFAITFPTGAFSGNKVGSTLTLNFGDSSRYYNATCSSNPTGYSLVYNKGDFGPGANATGSTLHLSDSLDAIVTIEAGNPYNPLKKDIPYSDVIGSGGPPAKVGPSTMKDLQNGQSGKIKLILTQEAIGGAVVVPPGKYIFETFRSVTPGVYAQRPITLGYTVGQIFPVDATCTINNGNTISVPFGDIGYEKLSTTGPSSGIKKDIQLTYSCSSSLTQDIEITIVATPTSFEETAIKTSLDNLGVVVMYNGEVITPNSSFRTQIVNGAGSDTITFAPVLATGNPSVQGNFTASATLIMTAA